MDSHGELAGRDAVTKVVLDGLVDVELIFGVANKPLTPSAVKRLVNASKGIPGPGIVVGHHVEPVEVVNNLVQLVSVVSLEGVGSSGNGQKISLNIKSFSQFLHEESKVRFVIRVGGLLGQHVVARELPVEVQTVETEVLHEVDDADFELVSVLSSGGHLGEDPASSRPTSDGEENLQIWIFLLERDGSPHPVVVTVLQACVRKTAWGPGYPISLLDAILDTQIMSVRHGHVEPRVPAAHLVGVIEDVTEAVVDDITEANVYILWPKLSQSRPDKDTRLVSGNIPAGHLV